MKKSVFKNLSIFHNLAVCCLVVLCIFSCTVHNQIIQDGNKSIPVDFTAQFYDQLDTIVTQYDNRVYTRSFMKQLANIENVNYSKPIKIDFRDKEMYLSFEDVKGKQFVLKFYGKRGKSKFVFYTNYETISFPVLFMTKEMDKYSVYLVDKNEVVFNNHSVNEGMLLLFGAGHSSKRDYKFKLL